MNSSEIWSDRIADIDPGVVKRKATRIKS